MTSKAIIEAFHDPATATISYLVIDPATERAAIVDSVLDYDPKSGRTHTHSADAILKRVRERGVIVDWHLETHVHADHLSGAAYLRGLVGGQVAIGSAIRSVQKTFGSLFNAGPAFARDGSQFDVLLDDRTKLAIGALQGFALHTPGHTPACMAYVFADADGSSFAFVGDTLFMPDYGTARCDFPGGDARMLYRSIQKLLSLPPSTRLYMCHDYRPNGRELRYETTVAEERQHNLHVRDGVLEDDFVAMRTARDATLDMPALILPSVQVNMRAGLMPEPESNGLRYLKIPVDAL